MKIRIKIVITSILIVFTTYLTLAQSVPQAHKDSLEIVVKKYYDINLTTFQANSTISDIDNIFKLFTDDFTYVHPKYGGVYSCRDLYSGYVRNQRNGDYNGEIVDIKIRNVILGLNVAVVERIYLLNDSGNNTQGEPQVTLFEFEKGKISKILEYW